MRCSVAFLPHRLDSTRPTPVLEMPRQHLGSAARWACRAAWVAALTALLAPLVVTVGKAERAVVAYMGGVLMVFHWGSLAGRHSRDGPQAQDRGHRLLPHTADILVSAWAPSEAECIAEAVDALIESFAEPAADVVRNARPLLVQAPTPAERLVAVLEEVIYLLDAEGAVPVATHIEPVTRKQVRGVFDMTPLSTARPVGPPPKAVTWHGLRVENAGGHWRCEVVIDV